MRKRLCSRCGHRKPLSDWPPNKDASFCNVCTYSLKGLKQCTKCKEVKLITEFHKYHRGTSGVNSQCKECCANRHTGAYIKCVYGLSEEQYADLLKKQDGKCAICGKVEATIHLGKSLRLSVDHDHRSGKARGLLCYGCNHLIGHMERSGYLLVCRVLGYLEEHGTPLGDPDGYTTRRANDSPK